MGLNIRSNMQTKPFPKVKNTEMLQSLTNNLLLKKLTEQTDPTKNWKTSNYLKRSAVSASLLI